MGEELHRSLSRLGVGITRDIPEKGPVHQTYLTIGHPTHSKGWWEGQRPTVFTMWEATVLPPGGRENIHEYDRVFVPSEQNLELFRRFHPDVVKVPLGFDPGAWHPTKRPDAETHFTFLTAGSGARKGIDATVAAFNRVFADYRPSWDEPTPKLIVKNKRSSDLVKGEYVSQYSGLLSEADEIALYAQAQCYIGASRGEGWGLMPLQAIAQGCPTILTNAHGHAEFAHLGIPISATLTKAEPFIYGDAGDWWDPDFDELCEAMWDVYVSYDRHVEEAAVKAGQAQHEFTWDRCAERLVVAIGDSLSAPDFWPETWHAPVEKLYQVIPNKDCQYEVSGVVYRFAKGIETYERGDLKRMMFENGNLDLACISDPHESGLLPAQIEQLGLYSARHARCPTCFQRLNTNVDDVEKMTDEEMDVAFGPLPERV